MNQFFFSLLRRKKRNRILSDDIIIEVLAFFTRCELAKVEGACRVLHRIVDKCFGETPFLLCDRLELDNKLDLMKNFLYGYVYKFNCFPYCFQTIKHKFEVFNEHGKRHKIWSDAEVETVNKKVSFFFDFCPKFKLWISFFDDVFQRLFYFILLNKFASIFIFDNIL